MGRHGPLAGARLLVGLPLSERKLLSVGICYALPDAALALAGTPSVPGLCVRPLSTDEVLERSERRDDWFFRGAVEDSLARGDRCFGGYMDGDLVTSSWYATKPVFALGSFIGFAPDCVWSHRLFTKREFRGRGLSTALKREAFAALAAEGFTTSLNVVEWTNDSSRRLQRKNGYRRVATLICLGSRDSGKTLLFGGREFGVHLAGRKA